jgi:uridine phosphorylase
MSSEFFTGRQYHIGASPGDLAPYILLCGDPARAERTSQLFDKGSIRFSGKNREFVTFTGKFEGVEATVMSTGIGVGPTEIAVIEASQCIERPTFIRIGTCGAITSGIHIGDLVISQRALPRENASSFYLPGGAIVDGTPEIVSALEKAAKNLDYPYHTGTTCSTSSFYGGQGRDVPGFPLRENARSKNLFPKLLERGVLNFEMETSLLYTLAATSTRGIRAGAVCAVVAERQAKRGFDPGLLAEAEQRCIETGLEAVLVLDARKR